MDMRDMVLAEGVIEPIAAALDKVKYDNSALRNIAWCLANMLKGDP